MAVDPPVLYNNCWVYLRDMIGTGLGSSHLNPSDFQIHNAYRIRAGLQSIGYGPKAIAGVIGNAQVESGITTGAIGAPGLLPNGAETLSDVPTSYMYQYYLAPSGGMGRTVGFLQWDRTSGGRNDLINFSNNYNLVWYDLDTQIFRLQREYDTDDTYHFWRLNYGNALTWAVYKDIENSQFSHYDAGECAAVWDSCWELSSGQGREFRRDNANFWYQYFIDHPNPPPTPGTGLDPWMYFLFNNRKKVRKNVKRWI